MGNRIRVLGLILMLGLGVAALFVAVSVQMFKSAGVYQTAVMMVKQNPDAQMLLGADIRDGFLPLNADLSQEKGTADLEIPFSGATGKGIFYVKALQNDEGLWAFHEAILRMENGSEVDVLSGEEGVAAPIVPGSAEWGEGAEVEGGAGEDARGLPEGVWLGAGLIGFSMALLVITLFSGKSKTKASLSLEDYYGTKDSAPLPEEIEVQKRVPLDVLKTRLAFGGFGISVRGGERPAKLGVMGVVSGLGVLLFSMTGLPPLVWLGGALIGIVGVETFVTSRWKNRRDKMEKDLPSFLTTLRSMVTVASNMERALEGAVRALDPKSELAKWLFEILLLVQKKGAEYAFEEMRDDSMAISPNLTSAVLQIKRLWEKGGEEYGEAFLMSAQFMRARLHTTNLIKAKAAGGWALIQIVIALLGGTNYLFLSSITSPAIMGSASFQIGALAIVVWMVIGYWVATQLIAGVDG